MSRLTIRKEKSVVEELATDVDNLSQFTKLTITLPKRDLIELKDYVKKINDDGFSPEPANQSLVIRKALRLLYESKKAFHKI